MIPKIIKKHIIKQKHTSYPLAALVGAPLCEKFKKKQLKQMSIQ